MYTLFKYISIYMFTYTGIFRYNIHMWYTDADNHVITDM